MDFLTYLARERYLQGKADRADAYWEQRAKVEKALLIGLPILAFAIVALIAFNVIR